MNKKRFYLFKNTIRGNFGEVDKPLNYTEIVNLLNEQEVEIDELNQENKQLRKQVESSETTSNATSHYNAFLESKITTLEEENKKLKNIHLSIDLTYSYGWGRYLADVRVIDDE